MVDDPLEAETVLVLGGDGSMLKAIRKYQGTCVQFTGLNYGHIGFLMNRASMETLQEMMQHKMILTSVTLLAARLYTEDGAYLQTEYAFNDFYYGRFRSLRSYPG